MIDQVWHRVQLLVAQGLVRLTGGETVQARVRDEEVLENLDRVEPYGFSYRPLPGAEAYLLFPAGDRSHGFAIVIGDRRYQIQLAEGEVALHDDQGQHVHLRRDGTVAVTANTKVLVVAPVVECRGHVDIVGQLTVNGKNVSDSHTHTCTGPGSPTSGVN